MAICLRTPAYLSDPLSHALAHILMMTCVVVHLNVNVWMQSDAVLGMALRRLTSLEAGKLQEEAATLQATIAGLEQLLADEKLVLDTVKRESQEISDKFGDERRTTVRSLSLCLSAEAVRSDLYVCTFPERTACAAALYPLSCITASRAATKVLRAKVPHLAYYTCCDTAVGSLCLTPELSVQIRAGESGALSEEDIVPNRPSVLVFSRKGYIKRMPADLFATQVSPNLSTPCHPGMLSDSRRRSSRFMLWCSLSPAMRISWLGHLFLALYSQAIASSRNVYRRVTGVLTRHANRRRAEAGGASQAQG